MVDERDQPLPAVTRDGAAESGSANPQITPEPGEFTVWQSMDLPGMDGDRDVAG